MKILPKRRSEKNCAFQHAVVRQNEGVIEIPMFIFHATEDKIVPFTGADRTYRDYCEVSFEFLEIEVSTSQVTFLMLLRVTVPSIVLRIVTFPKKCEWF